MLATKSRIIPTFTTKEPVLCTAHHRSYWSNVANKMITNMSFNVWRTLLCWRPSSKYSSQSNSSCICNAPFFFYSTRKRGIRIVVYNLFTHAIVVGRKASFAGSCGRIPVFSHYAVDFQYVKIVSLPKYKRALGRSFAKARTSRWKPIGWTKIIRTQGNSEQFVCGWGIISAASAWRIILSFPCFSCGRLVRIICLLGLVQVNPFPERYRQTDWIKTQEPKKEQISGSTAPLTKHQKTGAYKAPRGLLPVGSSVRLCYSGTVCRSVPIGELFFR